MYYGALHCITLRKRSENHGRVIKCVALYMGGFLSALVQTGLTGFS